jgi:hypothetical protein
MSPTWIEGGGRLSAYFWFFVVASAMQGAVVVIPAKATADEVRAAAELGHAWLHGPGEDAAVRREDVLTEPSETGPFFFVGETALACAQAPLPDGLESDGFCVRTLADGRVVLRGGTGFGTLLAADWYAQHAMGVRWFMPGPWGEFVPALEKWSPPALDRLITPAFLSRELSGLDREGLEWARRNGLHGSLPHTHALKDVFPPRLFDAHPEWFPLLEGRRYRPASSSDYNWQPNLALPEVAAHSAAEADAFFDREPEAEGMSLSVNDSICFDQSDATVRARGPLRWFRGRPDYSDVVFGFMNRVADEVAHRHSDKLLSAYAYYWCENTPSFSVRANVVPWLTADRSQWYDGAFRSEDRALIERWCHSGAKIVGMYDYLYGAPFLVPRVTTRLTAESIEFAYREGVRAYCAEAYPNWGLDGPKLWVTAQLLWDPSQPVDALLEDYYAHFWEEAASPMRRFYERCEEAWLGQPGPGWWLKYYQDEAQAELFPSDVCAALRSCLEDARSRARDPAVQARVEMVSASFAVTERFSAFCEARLALSRAAAAPWIDRERVAKLLGDYRRKRADLGPAYERAAAAGGLARIDLEPYLRDDPADGVAARLREQADAPVENAGLDDPGWQTLKTPEKLDDRTFVWSTLPWLGRGEPVEARLIQVSSDAAGLRVVSYRHCKSERLQQWIAASAGRAYEASVKVKSHVSPGNQTYLIMNWMDRQNHYVGRPVADRLPDGDWTKGKTLVAAGLAPPTVAFVGVGIYACDQTGSDFASFSGLSFKVGAAPIRDPTPGK